MTRSLLKNDAPEFVSELEERLKARQLVKMLVVLRARADLSQMELAKRIGCGQSRISKLENGVDSDVSFGDVWEYLQATDHAATFIVLPKSKSKRRKPTAACIRVFV
jgi:transcriptional regulator with XRE-family HTH domain